MNKDMMRGLYYAAAEYCEQEGKPLAWIFEQKFAELIIAECIGQINASKTKDPYNGEVINCYKNELLDEQIQYIKEHFGVEDGSPT